ncbi:carbon monoxide dehydrogenase subunit G [Aeromicrobium panaciterrae]|uniref:Carbon monoxide dehydrogenase subunit G n=1 Tax=Aeromicrobium panaciterrae TaxID=363861 RepID=A0ABU1UND8_9ACTN|nr:SRPBCC family protein [Aeromicrobium panaciterrae]MDR7086693.1 carbon monoxide dehydrogenase subunit G [Aeromicrobium panaciterrae]
MTSALHPCDRVGLDFVDSAPNRFANSVELNITPEQLFEVLADADSWPRWAKVITNVEWTTPEPRGVGTTRLVTMRGGLLGSEEFLGWDEHTMMAFRFNEASEKRIKAFAERYDIVPTASGCTLTWTLALEVTGIARHTLGVSKPVLNATFRRFLKNLRKYTDERYGA